MKHVELLKDLGGINPEIYEIYTKMLVVNEVCERFLNVDDDSAAQT